MLHGFNDALRGPRFPRLQVLLCIISKRVGVQIVHNVGVTIVSKLNMMFLTSILISSPLSRRKLRDRNSDRAALL